MGPPRVSVSLKYLLAAQLGTCVGALRAGEQDQVLRGYPLSRSLSYFIFIFLSLQLSPVAMRFGMPCLTW
jgi:hypothetical protein